MNTMSELTEDDVKRVVTEEFDEHYWSDLNPSERAIAHNVGRAFYDLALSRAAALSQPAAETREADAAEILALIDGADGSGHGPDESFTLYLSRDRAKRLHRLVTARIGRDEEQRAATPPAPDAGRETVSYLRLCFDAVMEGRDGDGQFSRKIYELLDELAAPAKEAL